MKQWIRDLIVIEAMFIYGLIIGNFIKPFLFIVAIYPLVLAIIVIIIHIIEEFDEMKAKEDKKILCEKSKNYAAEEIIEEVYFGFHNLSFDETASFHKSNNNNTTLIHAINLLENRKDNDDCWYVKY